MRVVVISRTIQEFEGVRYYKCGNYFQRKGVRLHRVVWARKHGRKPPKGFHVHHHDENTSNNQPGNLILKPGDEHLSKHGKKFSDGRKRDAMPVECHAAARVWHSSTEGRAWHAEQARAVIAKRKPVRLVCQYCGGPFRSKMTWAKFCHPNHRAAALRLRRRM